VVLIISAQKFVPSPCYIAPARRSASAEQVDVMLMGIAKSRDGIALIVAEGRIEFSLSGENGWVPQPPPCQRENRKAPGDQVRNNLQQEAPNLQGRACLQLY
jgi:hypothetical protein